MKLLLLLLLTTSALFAQAHSVTLTWNWAQGTGDPATGFVVQRATVSGGPYTVLGTVAPATTLTYTDTTNLVAGNTYFYTVAATGPGGESALSNETSVKIPASPPAAPTNLQGTAK
jgi:hypothetical protein